MAEEHHHDPTFYRSPRDAAAGPPEKLAYVAAFSPDGGPAGRDRGGGHRPGVGAATARWWASPSCPTPVMSCIISAGTPAPPRCARPGRTPTATGATWSCPGSARRASTSSTPSPTRHPRRWSRCSGRRNSASGPATRARTPCTAGRAICTCPAWAARNGADGPGGVALLDHSTFEVLGQFEADRGDQYLAYDVWWHINDDVLVTSEWATPSMIEDGVVPELLLGRKYGHRLHFWDMKYPQPCADRRPRRPAPDGAGAAARPRPGQEVRVRRRGGQRRGPVRLDLALARARREVGGGQGDLDPGRARPGRGPAPGAAARSARSRR